MAKAKRPDVAAELSAKMTQALEALRAQGGTGYPTSLERLRQLADPAAAAETTLRATGKPPFSERAVVAKKKALAAPVALREDLERLVASRQLLEFALEALSAAATPPWTLKKVSAQIDKPLRGAFEATVGRQAAAMALPDTVAATGTGPKLTLYLKRQPPPPPPEVALADRLVRALEAQRRQGPDSYPVARSRLVELTGPAPPSLVLRKAQKVEPFTSRVVPLTKKGKDPLLALADDVESAAGSPRVLTFLLASSRSASAQAFSLNDLKAGLTKPAQGPFVAALTRQTDTDALPPGVGWIGRKKERLLFRLEDVRGVRSPAPAPAPARPPAPAAADFEAAFDEAFARLDRANGSYNFVSLVDLRRALPLDRATFDGRLGQLRRAGRYSLAAAEGRHGLTDEQRAAGITEEGTLLLFVSRR
jgi:hypothetical protein